MTIKRTETIKFAVTPEEKEEIYSMADNLDVSVSSLIRNSIQGNFLQEIPNKLYWKEASKTVSKTALIVYLLLQEQGNTILSPSKIEQLGFMAKGTASKAIKELEDNGFIDNKGNPIIKEEQTFNLENSYSVYKLTFPNSIIYIGITEGLPERRWNEGKGYKDNTVMAEAISHYGWKNIVKEVIYTNLTKYEAERKERELISYYSSIGEVYNRAKL